MKVVVSLRSYGDMYLDLNGPQMQALEAVLSAALTVSKESYQPHAIAVGEPVKFEMRVLPASVSITPTTEGE